ncbi:hypothetical protein [Sinorhizobium americanum]|uniref:Uncharacterized protein n=1 Tax=Sinorhizobium americanum TaxID=194963 RepID=A0A4R2BTF5_9HYPH|nr:hypothetical protein [Sinorhizobium americanum]TCN30145.1 hypothetical protein EV184_10811 [Sinorhizobium americanum]
MRPLSATACIAATCIFALVTSAEADDNTMRLCKTIGMYARTIMEKRQADVPMSAMMETIDRAMGPPAPEAAAKFAREMVMLAYQKPGFSVAENQQEAIAEFGNQMELVCFQER